MVSSSTTSILFTEWRWAAGRTRRAAGPPLPVCETSLVWPPAADNPALARFVHFLRDRVAG